jgi:hypothetical protein
MYKPTLIVTGVQPPPLTSPSPCTYTNAEQRKRPEPDSTNSITFMKINSSGPAARGSPREFKPTPDPILTCKQQGSKERAGWTSDSALFVRQTRPDDEAKLEGSASSVLLLVGGNSVSHPARHKPARSRGGRRRLAHADKNVLVGREQPPPS